MEAKHTPGPWRVGLLRPGEVTNILVDTIGTTGTYARTTAKVNTETKEGEANARLIAAAPELLKALERWVSIEPQCFCSDIVTCPACEAKTAIAKAKCQPK